LKIDRVTLRKDIPFGGGGGTSAESFSSFMDNDQRAGAKGVEVRFITSLRAVLISRKGSKSKLVPFEMVDFCELNEEQTEKLKDLK
jgi:hypothetical protein